MFSKARSWAHVEDVGARGTCPNESEMITQMPFLNKISNKSFSESVKYYSKLVLNIKVSKIVVCAFGGTRTTTFLDVSGLTQLWKISTA